jgi:hypothetical protein
MQSQVLSDFIDCSAEIGTIKIHSKTCSKKIYNAGDVQKKIISKDLINHYKSRYLCFDDTLCITQDKLSFFNIRYYNTAIEYTYPSKAKTIRGIQIGKSTKKDIKNIYGKPFEESFNYLLYNLPGGIKLWFGIYDNQKAAKNYNPNLKNKVITISLY